VTAPPQPGSEQRGTDVGTGIGVADGTGVTVGGIGVALGDIDMADACAPLSRVGAAVGSACPHPVRRNSTSTIGIDTLIRMDVFSLGA
jgi:hypothetical protein